MAFTRVISLGSENPFVTTPFEVMRIVSLLALLIAILGAGVGIAAYADVTTQSTCTYKVVHVDSRLRVRANPSTGARIVGYLQPGQRTKGLCEKVWNIDRMWVRVTDSPKGYSDAYYLDKVG
jgi:hypothetical protein